MKIEFTVDSPTKVSLYKYKDTKQNRQLERVGKDKFFVLDLNYYRNAHIIVLNQAKAIYSTVMFNQLRISENLFHKWDAIELEYQMITNNRRNFDPMNFIAVIDKFFQDTLVKNGIIPDDGFKYVKRGRWHDVLLNKELKERICRITVRNLSEGLL